MLKSLKFQAYLTYGTTADEAMAKAETLALRALSQCAKKRESKPYVSVAASPNSSFQLATPAAELVILFGVHMRYLLPLLYLLLTALQCFTAYAGETLNIGRFVGDVQTKWLVESSDDRRMELLAEFSYIDSSGKKWTTPSGWIVDGASIPRFLWTLVGSPFTGGYRRASVIHDYYCDVKTEPWQAVHKMFYWASLAGGVSQAEAKVLYAGVFAGGPRWKDVHFSNHPPRIIAAPGDFDSIEVVLWQPTIPEEKIKEIKIWIGKEDPSLEEIEQRTSNQISQNEPQDYVRIPRNENFAPKLPKF